MSRTTPQRPVDIAQLFPELAQHSTTATRLHPRPGLPTTADSSIGGPLLWPAGEPWPVCHDGDEHDVYDLMTPANVRLMREIYAGRAEPVDDDLSEPDELAEQPIPLIAVAQLYRRDVPDFAGPDGTDVLQVLWCPLDHPDEGHNPRVELYWRRSADVGQVLDAPPEPPVVQMAYVPVPCVVYPEQVREYQYGDLLPEELDERIGEWEENSTEEVSYQYDLSLAPGWKVGGFANWSLSDPQPVDCDECGSAMTLLFTADSSEWQGGNSSSWRPVEEPEDASAIPTQVTIGRGYSLYVFRCPVSFDHPHATVMQ